MDVTSAAGHCESVAPAAGCANSLQRGEYWRALRNGCDKSDLNEQPGRTTSAQATAMGQQDKPPGMILETGSGKQDRLHTLLHDLFPDQLLKGGTSVAKQQRIINPGGYKSVRRSKKYGSRPPYMYTSLCPDPRYRIKQPEKKKE